MSNNGMDEILNEITEEVAEDVKGVQFNSDGSYVVKKSKTL